MRRSERVRVDTKCRIFARASTAQQRQIVIEGSDVAIHHIIRSRFPLLDKAGTSKIVAVVQQGLVVIRIGKKRWISPSLSSCTKPMPRYTKPWLARTQSTVLSDSTANCSYAISSRPVRTGLSRFLALSITSSRIAYSEGVTGPTPRSMPRSVCAIVWQCGMYVAGTEAKGWEYGKAEQSRAGPGSWARARWGKRHSSPALSNSRSTPSRGASSL
jgi:hypothetical protein